MTRLLTCGWETGDPNENHSSTGGTWSCANSSPVPKSPSAYYLKSSGSTTKTWIFAASKTDVYVRFHLYINSASVSLSDSFFVAFYDSAGTYQAGLNWLGGSTKFLQVQNGASVVLGTGSTACGFDSWHTIEWRWQASSATSGTTQVWQDGTKVIDVSGVDTTGTANINVQQFKLLPTSAGWFYDDLAINDTSGTINNGQIGDGSVVLLKPTGAGSNTVLARGGTDSGANWSQCNELPPSAAQYVYSSNPGDRDTYALQDIPSGSWTVNCVEDLVMAQNDVSGAGSLGLTIKSGTTTNEGTAQALTTSAAYYRQLYETDPATSSAWTNTAVNALEAGVTVR